MARQYLSFLKELDSISKNNMTIKELVDHHMNQIYHQYLRSLLNDNRFSCQALKELKCLNNPYLNRMIDLNYYFDHIYVLNLDRRPDRMKHMEKYLKKNGLFNWSRFSALDGKENPHYREWQNYKQQKMTSKERMRFQRKAIASAGSWAILKSMYLMLKDAIKKGYNNILVLQDDLLFHKDFVNRFLKIPNMVPNNWKLLYLGATQHNWSNTQNGRNSHYYFPMGTADGAFAVAIDKSIFQQLIDQIIKFDMPFDSGALKTLQRAYPYQSIVLQPNLLIADVRDSDLRNSRNIDHYGQKFRWNLKLYDIPKNGF